MSVTLDGPSVGWVNQELGYSADGDYELDAETQEEVDEGEATVSESYDWDFGPATCTALPADSSSESCQFDYEDGGEYHTITVTYTVTVTYLDQTQDEDFAEDSIDVKVQRIEIDASPDDAAICTGGVASSVHQTTLTATVTDGFGAAAPGRTVVFAILGNNLDPSVPDNGSLSSGQAVSDAQGHALVVLTSGTHGANDEPGYEETFTVTVKASLAGYPNCSETVDVTYDPPGETAEYLDPEPPHDPIDYLPADGESQCLVRSTLSYDGQPVDAHALAYRFKFWTMGTLNAAAQAEYGKYFDELSSDQQEYVFDNYGPDYEGPGYYGCPYGRLVPTGDTTDAGGVAETVYTVGTVGGYLELVTTDNNVFMPWPGSRIWLKKWWFEKFGGVYTVTLSGPNHVIVGQPFTITVSVTPTLFSGTAVVTRRSGSQYWSLTKPEVYWDANKDQQLALYLHEAGLKLPSPPFNLIQITNGTGSFTLTAYTMETLSVGATLVGVTSNTGVWSCQKSNVWAEVKATYIGPPVGPESEHDWPGYFDNDKPRAALPYGMMSLFNANIRGRKSVTTGDPVNLKIRDRGPWFPYKDAYPAGNYWYNDYWGLAGWRPLADLMQGLRRAGDENLYVINGAGLDLTQNAIESLGFGFSPTWSGTVYWQPAW